MPLKTSYTKPKTLMPDQRNNDKISLIFSSEFCSYETYATWKVEHTVCVQCFTVAKALYTFRGINFGHHKTKDRAECRDSSLYHVNVTNMQQVVGKLGIALLLSS